MERRIRFMARMHGGRRPNEKAKDFKGTMKKLIRYMAIYKVQVFFVAVFAICGTIFNIVGPKILGKATTEIFNGLVSKVSGGDGMNFGKIGQILLTVLCLYVISAICSFVQGYLMTGVSQKTTYRLRREISEKINRMPMSYFDTKPVGEVLSRVTNDVDTLGQSLNQSATQMITSVTTLIGVFIMMLSISPLMTVIAVLILPLSAGLIGFVMKHSQKYFVGQQTYLGNVNGQVEEIYGGHNIIKAFNKEEEVIEVFNETNDKLYDSAWKSQFFSGLMMPVMQFVGNLGYVAVAILGGYLTIKDVIEVGDIQSFIQYVRNFTQPLQQIAQVANMLQSTAAASERVFEFLEGPEEDQTVENPVSVENLQGNVEFEHVRFGYNEDKIIINDFSADVKEGQKIAIVGPTGAGKTTMIKLLLGYYPLLAGEITIGSTDLQKYNLKWWRKHCGVVMQDGVIFSESIARNIAVDDGEIDKERLLQAARIACIDNYIQTLPLKYNTLIGQDGIGLSQGQKQRILIARAVYKNPDYIFLDEATNALDANNERAIVENLMEFYKGKTVVIVAHRLSTVKNADQLIVIERGKIIETGTHTELIDRQGAYYHLVKNQLELGS